MTGAFADATGRTDEELRLELMVAAAGDALIVVLRFLNKLEDLGFTISRSSERPRPHVVPGAGGTGSARRELRGGLGGGVRRALRRRVDHVRPEP